MNRQNANDFDVITGPSMASACPVVETTPMVEPPATTEKPTEPTPTAATAEAAAA